MSQQFLSDCGIQRVEISIARWRQQKISLLQRGKAICAAGTVNISHRRLGNGPGSKHAGVAHALLKQKVSQGDDRFGARGRQLKCGQPFAGVEIVRIIG